MRTVRAMVMTGLMTASLALAGTVAKVAEAKAAGCACCSECTCCTQCDHRKATAARANQNNKRAAVISERFRAKYGRVIPADEPNAKAALKNDDGQTLMADSCGR